MKIKTVSIKNFRSYSNETFSHLIIYLGNLLRNADLLEVDIRELFVREYKQYLLSQESTHI